MPREAGVEAQRKKGMAKASKELPQNVNPPTHPTHPPHHRMQKGKGFWHLLAPSWSGMGKARENHHIWNSFLNVLSGSQAFRRLWDKSS